MNIINLTPHDITVVAPDAPEVMSRQDAKTRGITYSASGTIARVKSTHTSDDIPGFHHTVVQTIYGEIEGLPEPKRGTIYIIATLVLNALKSKGMLRGDVVSPDTFPPSRVEDSEGNIVAVKRFQR
jgi:hypothetical protein